MSWLDTQISKKKSGMPYCKNGCGKQLAAYKSITGMCRMCIFITRRKAIRSDIENIGKCLDCGGKTSHQNSTKRCHKCSPAHYSKYARPAKKRLCLDCGGSISNEKKSPRCRKCAGLRRRATPAQIERYRIATDLRRHLRNALMRYSIRKDSPSSIYLGCSIDELRAYLENRFKGGMTWENYGKFGWHIDHILPLCSFDLTVRKELEVACNYKNLQPLWAKENLSKGMKIL